MALRDMEHDGARLEQGEIAFFIGRNLPERMKRTMRGFLHLAERNKTNVVRLAHFFERPANAHVTRLSLAAIRRLLKGGNGGVHGKAPVIARCPFARNDRGHQIGDHALIAVRPRTSAELVHCHRITNWCRLACQRMKVVSSMCWPNASEPDAITSVQTKAW